MSDAIQHTEPEQVLELLRARAEALELRAAGDEDLLEAVLEHDVRVPDPDEAECRRYYAAHAGELRQGDIVEADHILFALTEATPIDRLRRHAEAVLGTLLRDEADFAATARRESNCPSAALGGELGQLSRGQCVAEFWDAMLEHGAVGLLPRLVRTRFGLHIVRVQRIERGSALPFDAARGLIVEQLRRSSQVRALQLYADELAAQAAGAARAA
jgi:peptidyl-prolyl cis-trans isomerase C